METPAQLRLRIACKARIDNLDQKCPQVSRPCGLCPSRRHAVASPGPTLSWADIPTRTYA